MIGAIIQARMNSTRLPGKVLKEVQGKPLLELLIERLRSSRYLDDIIIATTKSEADDSIKELAERLSIKYVRGSEDDVLGRYYQAAKQFKVDHIMRITADCPLIDPSVIDLIIESYMDMDKRIPKYDYLSNTLETTFPDGLDAEIFSFEVLEKINDLSDKKYQREHVCTYIIENPKEFRMKNIVRDEDLSGLRWTLDNPEDYVLIKAIYEGLYSKKKIFLLNDILDFLEENPELKEINKDLKRNEGFLKSLDKENFSDAEKEEIINNVILKKKVYEAR
ncbi:MAG: glycosyltransferase family protein [Thermodesulfovibrionia bacterium]|nr:glycosyltransferase family protein [Thermodesulfovibrionia bacterium]